MPENKRQDRMHKGKGVNQGEDTLRHVAGGGGVAVQGAQELIKPQPRSTNENSKNILKTYTI